MKSPVISEYDFPDAAFIRPEGPDIEMCSWQPRERIAVLGRGDKIEHSFFAAPIIADNVKIVQRPSGGHAVILSEKMVAFSVVLRNTNLPASKDFFAVCNRIVIAALTRLKVSGLDSKGISDITIGDKKIAGTAIYRNKHLIFYHAVLNICEDGRVFDRYLKFPAKSPEYRQNRIHSAFVTSLFHEGYHFSTKIIINELSLPDNYSFLRQM